MQWQGKSTDNFLTASTVLFLSFPPQDSFHPVIRQLSERVGRMTGLGRRRLLPQDSLGILSLES